MFVLRPSVPARCSLLGLVLLLGVQVGRAEEPSTADRPVPGAGETAPDEGLRLSPERQRLGGLMVLRLEAARHQQELQAYGKVLDVTPLLEFRRRARAAAAEAEVAAAALALAAGNRQRLAALAREEIIAGRELLRAESEWQAAQTREAAARRLIGEIRREAESAYGPELAGRALEGEAAWLDDLAAHHRQLLWVVLPPGLRQVGPPGTLAIAREAERAKAVPARPIAAAPRTDDLVQGETWFFETADQRLRAGMRVNVWVPAAAGSRRGVIVPTTAVVWHEGRPWAYKQTGIDRFQRVVLEQPQPASAGWFVETGFVAGDRVVVRGAQMLLSEEFRGRIPDEDDEP